MRTFILHKGSTYKYTHLLIALVLLFLVGPLVTKVQSSIPIFSCLFLGVLVLALRALDLDRVYYLGGVITATVALLLQFSVDAPLFGIPREAIMGLSWLTHAFFIFVSIWVFTVRIFSERQVTIDTLQGGLSIYLLMGVLWTVLFRIISILDAQAFNPPILNPEQGFRLFYFSFTTLTTLGYGDMVPKSEWAMVLTTLEAVAGQFFLAVFVARLVGLHIVLHLRRKEQ